MAAQLCKDCGAGPDSVEFYSGVNTLCKEHHKIRARLNRHARIEYYREYDRQRGCRKTAEDQRVWRRTNKKKAKASRAVAYAVRKGRLSALPCEPCGSTDITHAHHDDYDKPLDVRWLCPCCHRAWHDENGEGANAHD